MHDDTLSELGAGGRSETVGHPALGQSDPPTPPDEATGVRRRVPVIAQPAVSPPPDFARVNPRRCSQFADGAVDRKKPGFYTARGRANDRDVTLASPSSDL